MQHGQHPHGRGVRDRYCNLAVHVRRGDPQDGGRGLFSGTCMLQTELWDMDYQTARDRASGCDCFVHRMKRIDVIVQWTVPDVNGWLAELYAPPARLRPRVDERDGGEKTEDPACL